MTPTQVTYLLGGAAAAGLSAAAAHDRAVGAARAASFGSNRPVKRAADVLFVPLAGDAAPLLVTLRGFAETASLGALRRGRVRMLTVGGVDERLADLLEVLDERAVEAAAVGAVTWFDNPLDREVVEDLYHCALRVAKGRAGHEARLMVADSDNALRVTDAMTLQLAGLLFLGAERFQWLWRVRLPSSVAVAPASAPAPAPAPAPVLCPPEAPVIAAAPPAAAPALVPPATQAQAQAQARDGRRRLPLPALEFQDETDDDNDNDSDSDSDSDVGPDAEDCMRMQAQLVEQLSKLEGAQRKRAAQLRRAIEALQGAAPDRRLSVMADIEDRILAGAPFK